MENLNRYKFTFGKKTLTLTTDKDNLFMAEVEKVATEKYNTLKEKLPQADEETLAILLAVNSLSEQLTREIDFDRREQKLEALRKHYIEDLKEDTAKHIAESEEE